jgi:hypothetical protein
MREGKGTPQQGCGKSQLARTNIEWLAYLTLPITRGHVTQLVQIGCLSQHPRLNSVELPTQPKKANPP